MYIIEGSLEGKKAHFASPQLWGAGLWGCGAAPAPMVFRIPYSTTTVHLARPLAERKHSAVGSVTAGPLWVLGGASWRALMGPVDLGEPWCVLVSPGGSWGVLRSPGGSWWVLVGPEEEVGSPQGDKNRTAACSPSPELLPTSERSISFPQTTPITAEVDFLRPKPPRVKSVEQETGVTANGQEPRSPQGQHRLGFPGPRLASCHACEVQQRKQGGQRPHLRPLWPEVAQATRGDVEPGSHPSQRSPLSEDTLEGAARPLPPVFL